MAIKHVFVESNWVFEYAAPFPRRMPAAVDLLVRAGKGEFRLHIPAVCLAEAKKAILSKCQPKTELRGLREYLADQKGKLEEDKIQTVRDVIDSFGKFAQADLDGVTERLKDLTVKPNVDVFALNDDMLRRAVCLSTYDLDLRPFDNAILAAVLVRSEEIRRGGDKEQVFCQSDADLTPFDKNGNNKPTIKALYDSAKIWVFKGWLFDESEIPRAWFE